MSYQIQKEFNQISNVIHNKAGETIYIKYPKVSTEVLWTCRYSTSVTVSSETLEISNELRQRNDVVKEGNILNTFEVRTFRRSDFNTHVNQANVSIDS